jgi:hypothetical protein
MSKKVAITTVVILMKITGAGLAVTVTVELPEFVGELQPYPNQPTASFDLGTSFLQIDEVYIQIKGTFAPGVARSMITGESWELTPELNLVMDPGVGSCYVFVHPLESPFDVEGTLKLKYGATWDFLLDSKNQVSIYLDWGGVIPEISIIAGSVQISSAYITVEGTVPEPATILFLAVGVVGVRVSKCGMIYESNTETEHHQS